MAAKDICEAQNGGRWDQNGTVEVAARVEAEDEMDGTIIKTGVRAEREKKTDYSMVR